MKKLAACVLFVVLFALCYGIEEDSNLVSPEVTRKVAEGMAVNFYQRTDLILFDTLSYYDLYENRTADIYVFALNDNWTGKKDRLLQAIYDNSARIDAARKSPSPTRLNDLTELSNNMPGKGDFFTVYVSASKTKYPIWEFREGLPEVYYLFDIEQIYAKRGSKLPDQLKVYYNGPVQLYVFDKASNLLISLTDDAIAVNLDSLVDKSFVSRETSSDDVHAIQNAWSALESLSLTELRDMYATQSRDVHTIPDVPYFNQWDWDNDTHAVLPDRGSCVVMANASALFYYDYDNDGEFNDEFFNMVPFGHKSGSGYDTSSAGFYNSPGLGSYYNHPNPDGTDYLDYGVERALLQLALCLQYNFNGGGTTIPWDEFGEREMYYTNTVRDLEFSFEKKRNTFWTNSHTYTEIKNQMLSNRPMTMIISTFSWTNANDNFVVIDAHHEVAIVGFYEEYTTWGDMIGVYTNGTGSDFGGADYSVVYWNYSNLKDAQNSDFDTPWTLTFTPGGSSGTYINAPSAVYPTNNEIVEPGEIHFFWQDVSAAQYKVQISSASDFSSYLLNLDTSSTNASLTISSSGRYYWRVVAQNSLGNWCDFSDTYTFKVVGTPTLSGDAAIIRYGNVTVNSSLRLQMKLTGTDLTFNVNITTSPNFKISTTLDGSYSQSLNLVPIDGGLEVDIYVKFTPTASQSYNGALQVISGRSRFEVQLEGNGYDSNAAHVFGDDFSDNLSSAWTTSGQLNNSDFYVNRYGPDWGARRNPEGYLELSNDASLETNLEGWVYSYLNTTDFITPYNTTLAANPGLVTWTFNMQQIRPNPAGFGYYNSYGLAFVLSGTSTRADSIGSGYAVVLGQTYDIDPIRLVKYENGLRGTMTNLLVSNTTGLADFGTEHLSIKVTYDPAGSTWKLYVRNDGTAFVNPLYGSLTYQGSIYDNTYTGTYHNYCGTVWQGSYSANQTAKFDNISISVAGEYMPLILIASPDGGEILQMGNTYNVTWNTVAVDGYLKIELYKGNQMVCQLNAGTLNDGSQEIMLPLDLAPGSDYRMAMATQDGTVWDFSNTYFTINPIPALTVITPNGGQSWLMGNTYTAAWSSVNVNQNVKLELYKGGMMVHQFETDTPNDGSQLILLPEDLAAGTDYQLAITSSDQAVSDFSNNYFTITRKPRLTVTSPNGGQTWLGGNTYTVTWTSENIGSYVKIELYKGIQMVHQFEAGTDNDGNQDILIPLSQVQGSDYRIAMAIPDGTVWDFSDAYFTIESVMGYPPRPPQNVTAFISGTSLILDWDDVTQDTAGNPVTVDCYYVYCGYAPYFDLSGAILVGSYTESNATLGSNFLLAPYMFYKVSAVVNDREIRTGPHYKY